MNMTFPSPYGVSFILIDNTVNMYNTKYNSKFPSPYGVSFILIYTIIISYLFLNCSFRLLTEYHSFLFKKIEFIP